MQVIRQAREKLRLPCAPVQLPIGLEHEHRGLVDLIHLRALAFEGEFGQDIKEVCLLHMQPAYMPEQWGGQAQHREFFVDQLCNC